MHRLFTTFPSGLPGAGLLLLRAAVGASLAARGFLAAAGREQTGADWAVALVAIACGASLLAGFLTPGASLLAVVVIGRDALASGAPPWTPADGAAAWALLVTAAVAVALVGPGSMSADARLFGRREIEVPRRVVAEDPPIE